MEQDLHLYDRPKERDLSFEYSSSGFSILQWLHFLMGSGFWLYICKNPYKPLESINRRIITKVTFFVVATHSNNSFITKCKSMI